MTEALETQWRTPDLSTPLNLALQDRFAFVVTLYSDAILLDDFGRYQTGLTDNAWGRIVRYAGQPPSEIRRWPVTIAKNTP